MVTLAEQWLLQFGDPWLSDLVKGQWSPKALRSLSRAIELNRGGRADAAEEEARNARRAFHHSGNRAGELRARLEIIYSLQRSIKGEGCLSEANGIELELRRSKYTWELAQYLLDRGTCRKLTGDLEGAAIDITDALEITTRSAFPVLRLRALGLEAALERTRGNIAAAWMNDRAGLLAYWSGAFPALREHQFCSDLGFWAQEMKLWHFAAALARESVAALATTENRSEESVARYTLANTAAMAGLHTEAEAEYRSAIVLLQSLPQDEFAQQRRFYCEMRLAIMLASRGQEQAALEMLTRLRPQLVPESSIAIAFHKALGYVSFRRGQALNALAEYNQALDWGRRALRSMPREMDRNQWRNEMADVYRGAARAQMATGLIHEAESTWYEYLAATAGRHYVLNDVSPSEIRHATLVWYLQADDGVAIWLLDNRGHSFHWVPVTKSELDGTVAEFVDQCSRPESPREAIRKKARLLYDWLIRPIDDELEPGRTLLISPDGSLASIPFAALIDHNGTTFGERFALCLLIGAGLTKSHASVVRATDHAFLAGAPAVGVDAEYFPPLPYAVRELDIVRRRFVTSDILLGAAVTGGAIKHGLAEAAVFHFAGHAISHSGLGGLVLSMRSGSPEIFDARLLTPGSATKCKLAVLSACNSGTGEFGGRTDPEDLVRGFLNAGVETVVATRWEIDSRVTAALMSGFYDSLINDGKTVPEALHSAESEMRRSPATAHPYYWAGIEAFSARLP